MSLLPLEEEETISAPFWRLEKIPETREMQSLPAQLTPLIYLLGALAAYVVSSTLSELHTLKNHMHTLNKYNNH